ncbi:MAG TPA: hypothetical protein VJ783_24735 [Pirellulales bacterium]|nr:hypothetical protein [Pirellulales bacterium]
MFRHCFHLPICRIAVCVAVAIIVGTPSLAQSRTPGKRPAAASKAAAGQFRALAPGVEVTIPPDNDVAATFSRHDLVEVLAVDPEYGERAYSKGRSLAKDVVFTRNIWCLELTFKPMRMIMVDVPTKEGRFDRKLIWYLLYRVKNTGKEVERMVSEDGEIRSSLVTANKPIKFVPRIWLESWDTGKAYLDRMIPVAIPEIERREDAAQRLLNDKQLHPEAPARLLNTIEMEREIPPSPEGQDLGVWGVATWEDIDPRTDHFSIYFQGLTNAYQWQDAKEGDAYVYKKGDPIGTGRKLAEKTLRLNFWRPSDKYYEHEEEIRYGFYEHPGLERFRLSPDDQVDYRWLYR